MKKVAQRREPPLPLLPRPRDRGARGRPVRHGHAPSSARCAPSRCPAPASSTSRRTPRRSPRPASTTSQSTTTRSSCRSCSATGASRRSRASTPEAEQARAALVKRIDRIGKAGRRFAARRDEARGAGLGLRRSLGALARQRQLDREVELVGRRGRTTVQRERRVVRARRRAPRGGRRRVARGMSAGPDDQVTDLDARRGGGAAVARPSARAGPSRSGRPDRRAQLAGDVGGGEAHAEHEPAQPTRRAPGRRRGSRSARVGGQREVEAVGEAGGVEADDEAVARRRPGLPDEPRARGAVCSRLPVIWRPRGPRKARSTPLTMPVGDASAAVGGAADGEDDVAGLGGVVGPRQRWGVAGVDREHDEVAVGVDAGDLGPARRGRRRRSPRWCGRGGCGRW